MQSAGVASAAPAFSGVDRMSNKSNPAATGAGSQSQSRLAKADEQRATEAKSADEEKGLVKMSKAGATLSVHPTCVKAHLSVGWAVAE
jgi:hypothetical protein